MLLRGPGKNRDCEGIVDKYQKSYEYTSLLETFIAEHVVEDSKADIGNIPVKGSLNKAAEGPLLQPHSKSQKKSETEDNEGRDDDRQYVGQANIFYVRLHDPGKDEDRETKEKDKPVCFLDELGL